MEMIKKGAEAEIYLSTWMGRRVVIKRRIRKGYRIKELDEKIRKQRTRREAILMAEARKAGVAVPIIYEINNFEMEIVMEYVDGERLKDIIEKLDDNEKRRICQEIGKSIAMLHKNGIIHGDITTSNIILRGGKIHFIDFGLGMKSAENEARGVDLHLLMEAFNAAHADERLFRWVMGGYKKNFEKGNEVERKIEEIVRRGRYMRRVE